MILHLPRRLPLSSRAPIRDPPDRGEPTRAVTHRPRTTGIRAELRPHDTPTLLSRTDFSPLILARVFPLRLNTDQSRRPTASTTARTPLSHSVHSAGHAYCSPRCWKIYRTFALLAARHCRQQAATTMPAKSTGRTLPPPSKAPGG